MAQLRDWKLVYSLLDGQSALYQLPNEDRDQSAAEPVMYQTLSKFLRNWVEQEDYWVLHAHGHGKFAITLEPAAGQFASFLDFSNNDQSRLSDLLGSLRLRSSGPENRRSLSTEYAPDGKTWSCYFQLTPRESDLKADLRIDGSPVREKVFIGPSQAHPRTLPLEIGATESISSPFIDKPFRAARDGFYLTHHRGKAGNSVRSQIVPLDAKTVEQLRSLGYLR
jgi:hypothetical protein